MRKWIIGILLFLLIAGALLYLLGENRALRDEIAALEISLASPRTNSLDAAAPIEITRGLDRSEKLDLMRLRAEVTALRKQVRGLSAEGEGQPSSKWEQAEFAPPIPIQEWARVGASTPEDAVQTLLNYLYKLNTTTNEAEIDRNQPPSVGRYYAEGTREKVTNQAALTARLLKRPLEIINFQTGTAEAGEIPPGERVPSMVVPVRINYADGSSSIQNITFHAWNQSQSWSPRIKIEMIDGKVQATF